MSFPPPDMGRSNASSSLNVTAFCRLGTSLGARPCLENIPRHHRKSVERVFHVFRIFFSLRSFIGGEGNDRLPLRPCSNIITAGFEKAVTAAEEGAESTRNMAALAGRSNYVAEESLKGVPDPGAMAAAFALKAIAKSLASA